MLKSLIDGLNSVDRKTLEYASNHGVSHFVKIESNKYIGVFAEQVPQLSAIQTAGNWSYGTIKGV